MNAPIVIVTRAEPGASATATRLDHLGFSAVKSPALSLHLVDPLPDLHLSDAAGLIFTSANGVRFYCDVSSVRNLMAWCVGPATLEAAKAAGFDSAESADGNSDDLAALIIGNAPKVGGHLVHVANTAAAGTLKAKLKSAGHAVRFVGLYSPRVATELTPEARAAITSKEEVCVLIHSAKGAEATANLLRDHTPVQTSFICVSDKAAAPIAHLGATRIASRPNEAELMRAVQDWKQAL